MSSNNSGSGPLCGNSLESIEGGNVWSPTGPNSSNSYGSNSPPERHPSFDGSSPWSPNFNPCGNFVMTSTPEKPLEEPNVWSPTSPTTNHNGSAYSFPGTSPPGLGLLNSITNSTSSLTAKQTIEALNVSHNMKLSLFYLSFRLVNFSNILM